MATTDDNQPISVEEEKEISSLLESIKIDDDKISDLTNEQKETLKKLKLYQKEYYDYESKFEYELYVLRQKYQDIYNPIYEKRREALVGKGDAKIGTPNLPEFWLRALRNNSTVNHVIEEHDEEVLSYLNDIKCEYIKKNKENKEGFILSFHFAPNPFFSNEVLTKTYHMKCVDCVNEPVLLHTEACTINWYENKSVLKKNVIKKHNKNSKDGKAVQQTVNRDSFFHFFTSHKVPSSNVIKQLNKHEVAQLEMIIEGDYEVALTIKERIIPYAVDYYLGIIIESESNSIVSDADDSSYSSSENSNYNSYESNNSGFNDENSNAGTNDYEENENDDDEDEEEEDEAAKSNDEVLTS